MSIHSRFYPNLYTTAPELVDNTLSNIMLNMYNLIKHNPSMLLDENTLGSSSRNAYGAYSLQMSELLLNYFTAPFSNAIKIPLVPTYSFTRTYYKGGELAAHSDRESCQYSMTICIGNENSNNKNWDFWCRPLHIEDSKYKKITCDLYVPIIYNGIKVAHMRDPLPFESSTHVFLHYVDKRDESKRNLWYDKREYIGMSDIFGYQTPKKRLTKNS